MLEMCGVICGGWGGIPMVSWQLWHCEHPGASVLTWGLCWSPEGSGKPLVPSMSLPDAAESLSSCVESTSRFPKLPFLEMVYHKPWHAKLHAALWRPRKMVKVQVVLGSKNHLGRLPLFTGVVGRHVFKAWPMGGSYPHIFPGH